MHAKWLSGLLLLGLAQADDNSQASQEAATINLQSAAEDPYATNQAPPIGEKLSRRQWTVTCDSTETDECTKMLDDDFNTFWQSGDDGSSHEVVVDLSRAENIQALSVVSRRDTDTTGQIFIHKIYVSNDKENWGDPVALGTWYNTTDQKLAMFEPKEGQYLRLLSLDGTAASISELQIYDSNTPKKVPNGGVWGPTIDLPLVAVSGAILPGTGQVLVWSSWSRDDYLHSKSETLTAIWDPVTGNVTQRTVQETGHDMFCAGISYDGKSELLVTGGNNDQQTSLLDPKTDTWLPGNAMRLGRGYQASATNSEGRVFIIGGSWNGGTNNDKDGEIYDPATEDFSALPGALVKPMWTDDDAGGYRRDSHGWIFGWKNGTVFQAGPSKAMNWYYTSGQGDQKPAGTRGDANDAMSGNAVMFDAVNGKIITFGGSPSYVNTYATKDAHLIEIGEPGTDPKVSSAKNPSGDGMAFARVFHTSVVLPDGNVFTTGGQTFGVPFNDSNAIFTPELYDPVTNEFHQGQTNSIVRVYHSISLLLKDGRVFNGGGGLGVSQPTNHFDAQIYTPDYLLNDDGTLADRPIIDSVAEKTLQPGDILSIKSSAKVSKASLIRYGATTHTVNTDQRRVVLDSWTANGDSYEATLPADAGALIPGPWMLFILNDDGVPSIAETIYIQV
ncbi:uncharacterized protein N7511_009969 [Penicillium nucicola]|uniref:uncharacterized protein n=1 Tax=Penicillium nucicola TaxID=1850975 RepID=UPI0025458EA4|nr:uncharacterized protein N7511_009969 [Penicillium nucicola]KAJ5748273.1 hypothetical protein N7511_009969 [Penicillium nucicola]